ncbi:MAG: hypothetical protein NC302_03775 [Bacteroidales bacterium]|nr:hypothetical protein [Bacteroidales bacterium]MCM1414597.1 hypothetical protein [bacterium]MCM1423854.1 hypothetical protein [bacterium]
MAEAETQIPDGNGETDRTDEKDNTDTADDPSGTGSSDTTAENPDETSGSDEADAADPSDEAEGEDSSQSDDEEEAEESGEAENVEDEEEVSTEDTDDSVEIGSVFSDALQPRAMSDVADTAVVKAAYRDEDEGYTVGAITKDGGLYTWGANLGAELGHGGEYGSALEKCQLLPIKILDDVVDVSLVSGAGAAVTKDGSLYRWGLNDRGQIGNGESGGVQLTPLKVLDNVADISLETSVSAAVTKDGSLYMWGSNSYGQIGNGYYGTQNTPYKVQFPASSSAPADIVKNDITINQKGHAYANFILKDNEGNVLKDTDLKYSFDGINGLSAHSDENGLVTVKSPLLENTSGQAEQHTLKTVAMYKDHQSASEKLNYNVTMNVTVIPLSFTQEWELGVEGTLSGSLSAGVGASVGVAQAEASGSD